jgi:hypothetical protein
MAQMIGIGTVKVCHKSESGGIIYTLPITTTDPEKNTLLVF